MIKKKFDWMKILTTGTFTDKKGKKVTIDEGKLDKIIASTDLSKEPQFVIEHPHFDEVGHGTISDLKRVGKALFALPKEVNEKFKLAVNSGKLPGRSVRIDEVTSSLDHIAFLPPEIQPAVAGLGSYSFSQEGENTKLQLSLPGVESHFAEIDENDKIDFAKYEVSSWPFKTLNRIFRNLKNVWIEKFGKEEADLLFPEFELEETGNPPSIFVTDTEKAAVSFSQFINGDEMKKFDFSKVDFSKPEQVKEYFAALQAENQELTTNLETTKTDLQTARQTISLEQQAKNRKEVLDFCESDLKLKVIPADKEKVVNLVLAVKEKGKLEFSAADNSKVQFDAYDYLKVILKQLPDKIELQEVAKDGIAAQTDGEYEAGVKAAERINKQNI